MTRELFGNFFNFHSNFSKFNNWLQNSKNMVLFNVFLGKIWKQYTVYRPVFPKLCVAKKIYCVAKIFLFQTVKVSSSELYYKFVGVSRNFWFWFSVSQLKKFGEHWHRHWKIKSSLIKKFIIICSFGSTQ